MAVDPALRPFTVSERRNVRGTSICWDQPAKILPIDEQVRTTILAIEREYAARLGELERRVAHLPSRVRSLVWILASLAPMAAQQLPIAEEAEVCGELAARLPQGSLASRPSRLQRSPLRASA